MYDMYCDSVLGLYMSVGLTGSRPATRLLLWARLRGPGSYRPQSGELERGLEAWRGLRPGGGRTYTTRQHNMSAQQTNT